MLKKKNIVGKFYIRTFLVHKYFISMYTKYESGYPKPHYNRIVGLSYTELIIF